MTEMTEEECQVYKLAELRSMEVEELVLWIEDLEYALEHTVLIMGGDPTADYREIKAAMSVLESKGATSNIDKDKLN